ncbi:MAG: VCBS repeat-containing protein [Bryobacterales bacterium]|nr:VCBS repeat-containing protein [Bryobacterales bacterium]
MRLILPCLLATAGLMPAQSLCPALRFISAPESTSYLTGGTNAYVAGIALQSDGTRTEYRYRTLAPFARAGSTANFVNELLQCTTLGPRNPASAPSITFGDEPGVSSRNPVVANLKGTATPAIVGLLQGNNLSVHFHDLNNPNAPRTDYPIQRDGEGLVAADFNGDGKRDIAVVHNRQTSGIVSVFLGNGDGTLQAAVTYPVGGYPDQMTAFDFNGDGRSDLAVANQEQGNVSILRGNANGTLTTATNFTSASFMRSIAAGDVTGDGKADLIGGNMGFLVIMRGNGDATFQAPTNLSTDFTANYIAPSDVNKDGRTDLVIADSQTGRIVVMLGAGNGTFPTRRDYAVSGDPANVIVTDVDRDGNLDIAVASGHPDALTGVYFGNYVISVLFGRGDGTFYGAPAYAVGSFGATLTTGDINGDGRADIVSAASGGFFYLPAQDGGAFGPSTKVNIERGAPASGNVFASDVLTGDFNKDGKQDVAILETGDAAIHVAPGNGNGTFQRAVRTVAGTSPRGLAAGDVNGDGNLDLVAGQSPNVGVINNVVLLRGNGNGTFQAPVEIAAGANPQEVQLRDLNGDGRLDLITTNYGEFNSTAMPGDVSVLLGNGNGTFQTAMRYAIGRNPTSVNFGDANNDGRIDMVVTASGTGFGFHTALLTGKGDGTFNNAVFFTADFGPSDAILADFNADGKADLLTANCCGDTDITYRLGNGDGTFQDMRHHPPGSPAKLLAADFDNNGSMDFAVVTAATSQSNMIAIYINQLGGVPCTYSTNRTVGTASPLGDTLGLTISTNQSSCSWNAQSDAAWVTFGGTFPRTGAGALRITVAANAGMPRVANLTIAGRSFVLTQAGSGCSYAISPSSQSTVQAGGNFSFAVNTSAGCPWTAISSQNFLTIPQAPNAGGPGNANYTVAANAGAMVRSASVSVAGEIHQVIQSASNPSVQFNDVPLTHPFYNFISMMRDASITAGCGNNNYCPDAITTRGQMSVFIIRAIYGSDNFPFPAGPYFADVAADHPFFKWIQKMRELGITTGCTATTYCPDAGVTRGQMAVFLIRARLGLASGDPLAFPATAFFTDVAATHPFFSFIQKMRQLAVTSGCTATTYCADDNTTRGQMSVFIVRGLLTP